MGITFWKSFTYGTSGFTTITNLAPRSTAMSTLVVERMPPSIELAALDLDRLVDHRQRGGGGHRARDRHVVPVLAAEHDPLAGVEVGGGQVELVLEQAEVVGAVGVAEHRLQVVLDRGAVVEARTGSPSASCTARSISETWPSWVTTLRARPEQPQRHQRRALGELEVVGPHQRAAVDVPERRGHLLVDHPHHLLGGHAVGHQAADERAGAGAHVDVELVDRAVHGQQVERAQGADLVDAAGEAAAAQHQRGAGAPLAARAPRLAAGPCAVFLPAGFWSLTTSPIGAHYRASCRIVRRHRAGAR